MKTATHIAANGLAAVLVLAATACRAPAQDQDRADAKPVKVLFLHHSTGECVWNGGVAAWFRAYNAVNKTDYAITERAFPADEPYGWENYPYDYWNIWVRHAGDKPYKNEPTLEMLTKQHNVIVWKHCFPVSGIEPDTGEPDVAGPDKRIENYKLQYAALKAKMRAFPDTKFIVWTGAALLRGDLDEDAARRAKAFFAWVRDEWDQKGDNIFVWDFYTLETDGGLYLKPAYGSGEGDSHPNAEFSEKVAPMFCRRVVDVIEGKGDTASVTGAGGTDPRKLVESPAVEAAGTAEQAPPATERAPEAPAVGGAAADKPARVVAGTFVVDNAESSHPVTRFWADGAEYVTEGDQRVIRLDFIKGEKQDWGEYGPHLAIRTRAAEQNVDVSAHKYVALRMKSDREMMVVLTLVTRPGGEQQGHFSFSVYPQATERWKWFVYKLDAMDLSVEGAEAYKAAGEPGRIKQLTTLMLCTNARYEEARVLVDDVMFLTDLPADLRPHLQQP